MINTLLISDHNQSFYIIFISFDIVIPFLDIF